MTAREAHLVSHSRRQHVERGGSSCQSKRVAADGLGFMKPTEASKECTTACSLSPATVVKETSRRSSPRSPPPQPQSLKREGRRLQILETSKDLESEEMESSMTTEVDISFGDESMIWRGSLDD